MVPYFNIIHLCRFLESDLFKKAKCSDSVQSSNTDEELSTEEGTLSKTYWLIEHANTTSLKTRKS